MRAFVVLLLAGCAVLCRSGSIKRNKRGYLSRTGLCAKPENNFKIKDPRLNFWGVAYVLPDDANPKCTESECSEDSHCDADRKCCKNYCGGMVCTPTMRDPDPCKKFMCPTGQTCKVQYVPCVMPKCKDAIAVNRPTCIKDPAAAAPPAAPPAAPANPAQAGYAPSIFQQPLAYQQQPQAPPAPFMQPPMAPMGSMPPAMPPMGAFQNDELGNEAGLQTGLAGSPPGMETGLSDASLMNAFQNENQDLAFQNDKLPPSDQSNFFQPPPAEEQQQQQQQPPSADAPGGEPPAIPMFAPQPGWDRSSRVQ
ncbi:uncharacterized protein LOC144653898 isoform X2 [Oculina patagonica]